MFFSRLETFAMIELFFPSLNFSLGILLLPGCQPSVGPRPVQGAEREFSLLLKEAALFHMMAAF